MRKVLTSIFVLFVILILAAGFTSCTRKQEPAPVNTSVNNTTVNVEYRITNQSGNVGIRYIAPDANGNMVTVEQNVLRTTETIAFTCKTNNLLSIESWNLDGLRKEIVLEIYVNGEIFTSGSLNFTTGIAKASGTVY